MKIWIPVLLLLALAGCASKESSRPLGEGVLAYGLAEQERAGLGQALQARSEGRLSDRELLGVAGETHRRAMSRLAIEDALGQMADERHHVMEERKHRDAFLIGVLEREHAEQEAALAALPPPGPPWWKTAGKVAGEVLLFIPVLAFVLLSSAGQGGSA